jgi:colicin import membrane protein
MIVYNGYPLSVFVAISLHSLLLAALLYLQADNRTEVLDIVQPPMVKAILVDENPQMRNEDLLEQQRLIRLDDQRRQEDARRQAEAEEQRRQQAEAEQRRQQQEQAAQQQREQEAAAQRERQQREAEQRRQQELAAEQDRQKQAEAERQRQQELAAEQQRRQAEAATQAAAAAAAEAARTEQEMVMSYTAVIHDLVQQNWSRPPSARNGMTTVLRIRMVPTGDVLDVEIVQSSGDPAFDRAAESAVYRVGQFRELQGMPINLFNTNFRSFLLTFRPEDLLN